MIALTLFLISCDPFDSRDLKRGKKGLLSHILSSQKRDDKSVKEHTIEVKMKDISKDISENLNFYDEFEQIIDLKFSNFTFSIGKEKLKVKYSSDKRADLPLHFDHNKNMIYSSTKKIDHGGFKYLEEYNIIRESNKNTLKIFLTINKEGKEEKRCIKSLEF